MTPGVLEMVGLRFEREGRLVLDGVDARFIQGSITLVTGASGSGKSTLLHLLGGLLRPTAGVVRCDEAEVSRFVAGHRDRWRRGVGLALQSPHLLPELTASENVMVPLVPQGFKVGALRQRALAALKVFGVEALAGRGAGALSGGERQRVALARAWISSPGIVLLDEPTAHQDALNLDRVWSAITAAKARGAIVVVATHDQRLVEQAQGGGDTIWWLSDGRLEAPCCTP